MTATVTPWITSPMPYSRELIRVHARKVAAALEADLTDSWLLVDMWAIPSDDVSYPLPAHHPAWDQLNAPSDDASHAFRWINEGRPL